LLIETEIKLIHPDARRPHTNAILVGLRSCREAGTRPASCSLDPTKIALSWASYGLQRSFGSPPVQTIRPFDLLLQTDEKDASASRGPSQQQPPTTTPPLPECAHVAFGCPSAGLDSARATPVCLSLAA
jgi:hypothetical protein